MTLTSAKDLVADARARIENLTPEQLSDELAHDEVVLVDLREHAERERDGIIPAAVHIPRGLLEFCADPTLPAHREELDPARRIVLYCAVGGRSALAARALGALGYPDVAHLDGGFEAWRLAGGVVEPAARNRPRHVMVTSADNKRLVQRVFAELSSGNPRPFLESLADDVRWRVTGTTRWSRTYEGKQTVLNDLLRPLFSQFATQYTSEARGFIADGETVVVEARGHATTKAGRQFDNLYCYVFRLADGKVKELTEYCDTQLVAEVLGDPRAGVPASGA
jgi:uncharacterized protein